MSAIPFGVPGRAASAASTPDGYPLTRQGQAGRALGVSCVSALMGGLFGAALIGSSLAVLRPAMPDIDSPERLAFAVFGISIVAVLSGSAPLRGLAGRDSRARRRRLAPRRLRKIIQMDIASHVGDPRTRIKLTRGAPVFGLAPGISLLDGGDRADRDGTGIRRLSYAA
jgi:hypothetical protein